MILFDKNISHNLPNRIFHYTRIGNHINWHSISDSASLFQDALHFSIIDLDQTNLHFSRIVTRGDHFVWEYGQVSLTSGPTRIMGRHIGSLDRVSTADGRVDHVLKNARELIEGAVLGPDRAVYFSHADMVKTYTGGVIKTIAGRRAGEASDLSADCLWHPQVTGLDTDGRIFVKSVGKVVGQEKIEFIHRLKVID